MDRPAAFSSGGFISYQVIARKWRPQSFDQLVGQNHISQTLGNALKNGRLPHALLFTGPRGTGKTSSARILAKSLRCPNAVDFQPCNVCPSCLDISLGRSIDVIEIDGASNNGVDAIRELREGVIFMPSSGKYKIYIIDEVHMLSTSAFNALLKTLEEPPPHVIFIMATTEVQKIPQTILSRCQRFDFRSISTRQITDRLKLICETDGVKAEEEALWMVARQGHGSMRDSQSLLDQVITFANGPLNKANVVEILGLTDHSLLFETLQALVNRDTAATLGCLQKIHLSGVEAKLFIENLLENIRHLLLIKISTDALSEIIEMPDSEIRFLRELGAPISEADIHLLFDMALKGADDIPKSSEPRMVLEMLFLRMASAPQIVDLQQILARTSVPSSTVPPSTAKKLDPMGMNPTDRWYEFVQNIRQNDSVLAAKIENLLFVGQVGKNLEVALPVSLSFLKDQMSDAATKKQLQILTEGFFGPGHTLEIKVSKDSSAGTSAQTVDAQKSKQKEEDVAKQVADHPLVKSATLAFKGQVKSIRDTRN